MTNINDYPEHENNYEESCLNFLVKNFKIFKEFEDRKTFLEKNGYYIVDDEELTIYKNIHI